MRYLLPLSILLSGLSACSAQGRSSTVPSVQQSGLQTASGSGLSFKSASGKVLTSDSDYDRYIDTDVQGDDKILARTFLKLMPPGSRGDFVYIDANGKILSNNRTVARLTKPLAKFPSPVNADAKQSAAPAGGSRPLDASFPCPDSTTGPYLRQCSAEGVTAVAGSVTWPCSDANLGPGDGAFLYMGGFGYSSGGIDAGLMSADGATFTPFVRTTYGSVYSGWTNEQQTYSCGEHVSMMYGIFASGQNVFGALILGVPNIDPTAQIMPPDSEELNPVSYIFFAPPSDFYAPGSWNGQPTPCTTCTAKRMSSVGFGSGNSLVNDKSCFGACDGVARIHWDQVTMGQLIAPCNLSQNTEPICTLQYFTDGTWNGLPQYYPNDNRVGSLAKSNPWQFVEGINLAGTISSADSFHVYAPPYTIQHYSTRACPPGQMGTIKYFPGDTDYVGNTVAPGIEEIWTVTENRNCPETRSR